MWEPSSYVLGRVAGTTNRVLDDLNLKKTSLIFEKYQWIHLWLQAQREYICSDLLFHEISLHDGKVKSSLVAIKRSLFNGKLPNRTELQGLLHVGQRNRREILRYCSRIRKCTRLKAQCAASYEIEKQYVTRTLLELFKNEDFLKTLQVSAPSLFKKIEALAHNDVDRWRKAERQTVNTAARYMLRMASKTSPFGRFGPVMLGKYLPENTDGWTVNYNSADNRTQSSLSLVISQLIIEKAAGRLELSDCVKITLNKTIMIKDGEITFLQPAEAHGMPPYTTYRKGRVFPEMATLLEFIAETERGLSYDDIFCAYFGGSPTEEQGRIRLLSLLENLIKSGLLIRTFNLNTNSLTRLRDLEKLLFGRTDEYSQWLGKNIIVLQDLADRYANESVANRKNIHRQAHIIINRILEKEISLKETGPIFIEDTYNTSQFVLGKRFFHHIKRDLSMFLDCIQYRDKGGMNHLMFTDMYVENFGVGGVCSDINMLVKLYSKAIFSANYSDSTYYHRMSNSNAQVLNYMTQLLDEIDTNKLAKECNIAPDKIARMLDTFYDPKIEKSDGSVTLHLQLIAKDQEALDSGDFDVVVNYTLPGFGRFFTRYCQLFRDSFLPEAIRDRLKKLSKNAGAPVVEVLSILQNNAQVHPKLTEMQIVLPGEEYNDFDPSQIPLGSVYAKHCEATDNVLFYAQRQEIIPMYMGFFHAMALPISHRVFLDGTPYGYHAERNKPLEFRENILPFVNSAEIDLHVRHYPRTRIGRVIIERETWCVDKEAFPHLPESASEFEIYFALNKWRAELSLPQRAFIRIKREKSEPSLIYHQNSRNDHKPIYFDFQNIFTIRELVRFLKEEDTTSFQFEEMLPGVESTVLRDGAVPVTLELQIEFNRVLDV